MEEKHNLATEQPEIATRLRKELASWAATLDPPGFTNGRMSVAATSYFDFYLDGKPAAPLREKSVPTVSETSAFGGWLARNGELSV